MITTQDIKNRCLTWLDPSTQYYDALISEIIKDVEQYICERINYRYSPKEYVFSELKRVEANNRIILDKTPLTRINKIETLGGEIINDYTADNYKSVVFFCNCSCVRNVKIEYVVGGLVNEYPAILKKLIIDLVIRNLNHYINNAHGNSNLKIGGDIAFSFDKSITPEEEEIIRRFTTCS